MKSACNNSKLVSTSVSSSRSRVLRHVAIRSNCLILEDPSDPPALEKGQMRFFRRDPPDPPLYTLYNIRCYFKLMADIQK